MTTTYELYTNENGTPKAVEGKAPAILERVEALESKAPAILERVEALEGTLDNGVVTSVNGNTGDITPEQTGCLPFGGGTMTGRINFSKNTNHYVEVDSNGDLLLGGSGSLFRMRGLNSDTNQGGFQLRASDGSTNVYFIGYPDGGLTWGGKNIVRSVNGTNADADGNVTISLPTPKAYVTETWKSGNSWYRKWSDGWIEQGGKQSATESTKITLNTAFSNTNYQIVWSAVGGGDSSSRYWHNVTAMTTTTVTIKDHKFNSCKTVTWYACGY